MEIVNFMEETNKKDNNSKIKFRISNKIDYDSSFRTLERTLSSHAEGLRELAKNSENAMIGNKVAPKHTGRDCILLFSQRKSTKDIPLIGFLDFIGFDRSRVEKFEVLNKSDAALYSHTKKEDARGGHGNGGKVYGAFHFEEATWHVCLNNKYNQLTYETNYGKVKKLGLKVFDEQHVTNPATKLSKLLKEFGYSYSKLLTLRPEISKIEHFTFFIGRNPKNFVPGNIIKEFLKDPEAYETLENINLYQIKDGKKILENTNKDYIHRQEKILPHEFFKSKKIDIPNELVDPLTGETISFKDSTEKYLILKTSDTDFLKSPILRQRHVIRGRHSAGLKVTHGLFRVKNLTNFPSGFPKYLYGDVFHDGLDARSTNTRKDFNRDPFIRALEHWMSEIIDEIAKEFAESESDKVDKQSQEKILQFSEALQDIIKDNKFLDNPFGSDKGSGKPNEKDGEEDDDVDPPVPPKKKGKITRIELNFTHKYAGIGVVFRPNIKSFDENGEEVTNESLDFQIRDESIVAPHERKLNLLHTKKSGSTTIRVLTKNKKIKSNWVNLNVTKISKINFDDKIFSFKERTSIRLNPKIIDNNNSEISSAYLTYIANDDRVASPASTGLVRGRSVGETQLRAMSQDCESNDAKVIIEYNEKKEKKPKEGGFPTIKYSGISFDPLEPEKEEVVRFSRDTPPVWQRVMDVEKNIWWINLQSPFAHFLWESKSKSFGDLAGARSKQFRIYVVMQWFEIMARINLMNKKDTEVESMDERQKLIDLETTKFHKLIEPHLERLLSAGIFKVE